VLLTGFHFAQQTVEFVVFYFNAGTTLFREGTRGVSNSAHNCPNVEFYIHDSTTKQESDTKLGAHTDIDGESHPLLVLHGFCTSTSDSTWCLTSDLLFHYYLYGARISRNHIFLNLVVYLVTTNSGSHTIQL